MPKNRLTSSIRALILCLTMALPISGDAPADEAFPSAKPESVGVPSQALELIDAHLRELVAAEEIVGGELAVIKNRRTIYRQAYGWHDRDAGVPLEAGAVYCVRSMTKPLVGTAIQMLIDDGRLSLETPVRAILESFDHPETRNITLEHLLTHTAGFPFTTIGRPLGDYTNLGEIAAEAVAHGLDFEPGSKFQYSDAGSDTLGAIVEQVTGTSAAEFIEQRILEPLGMSDSVTLLDSESEGRQRVPSAYSGGTGAWERHWSPTEDPPIFHLFLTSQSLYSTTTDYARFLALWMDGGMLGDQRLLSTAAIRRGLTPVHHFERYPSTFENLKLSYGQQWMVYTPEGGAANPLIFGHGGSDGTHAWAWPEQDLMVLFFTQSRGSLAGMSLEEVLQTALVDRDFESLPRTAQGPSAEEMREMAGLYWDETNPAAYYVISRQGKRLMFERPGTTLLVFKATDAPGRFVHEANKRLELEFLRGDDGTVTHMKTMMGDRVEHDPRHVPEPGLPSVAEVVAMVQKAHGIERLTELGAISMTGKIEFLDRKLHGDFNLLFDATRERTELNLNGNLETVLKENGEAWTTTTATGKSKLRGARLEQALHDHMAVRFGDWTQSYEDVEVLKRIQHEDESILLVRVVPQQAPGATMFIDEATGRVVRTDSLAIIPGIGMVGLKVVYRDFRNVGGMQLPFHMKSVFSNKLIGRVETRIDDVQIGVELAKKSFKRAGTRIAKDGKGRNASKR
ncbi:MAG: serine hydrolase domain-containing protein [Acidobacteriota bacterium]